jgi:hypothetical protein
MNATPLATSGARKRQVQTPPKGKSTPPTSPELMDRFTRETEADQNMNLLQEHQATLQAQRAVSQGRVAALLAQLQTQLFAIWNEVWLQRQKVHDEAFKAWIKLLVA